MPRWRPRSTPAASVQDAEPLLSVIVPVHDVEDYVEQALRSVLDQTYRNLEVLIVDDASTDRTPEICASIGADDPRVRIVAVTHRGVAACRNLALSIVTGELVAFADGDDIVEPLAYERMVAMITASGSDVVTGNVKRFDGGREWQVARYRETHAERRTGVTLDDLPSLVCDQFVWNKVFRAEFLRRIDLTFVEGVFYSDMVPISRALMLAGGIDVLSQYVYRWRLRRGSITQNKADPTNTRQRLAALDAVLDFVAGHDALRDAVEMKLFTTDLWPLVQSSESLPDHQREELEAFARRRWLLAGDRVRASLDDHQRMLYAMSADHGAVAAAQLARWLREMPVPATVERSTIAIDQTGLPPGTPVVPAGARELTSSVTADVRVDRMRFEDTTLVIEGHAPPERTTGLPERTISIVLAHARDLSQELCTVDGSRFDVRVDLRLLADGVPPSGRTATWELRALTRWGTAERDATVMPADGNGAIRALGSCVLDDGTLFTPQVASGRAIVLAMRRPHALVDAITISGRDVAVRLRPASAVGRVELAGNDPDLRLDAALSTEGDAVWARFQLPERTTNVTRKLNAYASSERPLRIGPGPELRPVSHGVLSASLNRKGNLCVHDRPCFVSVTGWTLGAGSVTATGVLPAEHDIGLGLGLRAVGSGELISGRLGRDDDAFTWQIDLEDLGAQPDVSRFVLDADKPGWDVRCMPEAILRLPGELKQGGVWWYAGVRASDEAFLRATPSAEDHD